MSSSPTSSPTEILNWGLSGTGSNPGPTVTRVCRCVCMHVHGVCVFLVGGVSKVCERKEECGLA